MRYLWYMIRGGYEGVFVQYFYGVGLK